MSSPLDRPLASISFKEWLPVLRWWERPVKASILLTPVLNHLAQVLATPDWEGAVLTANLFCLVAHGWGKGGPVMASTLSDQLFLLILLQPVPVLNRSAAASFLLCFLLFPHCAGLYVSFVALFFFFILLPSTFSFGIFAAYVLASSFSPFFYLHYILKRLADFKNDLTLNHFFLLHQQFLLSSFHFFFFKT